MSTVANITRSSVTFRTLRMLGRIALVGLILWLLAGVVQLVARLGPTPQRDGNIARSREIPWVNLLDGAWQLQGAPWQVSTQLVDEQAIDDRLLQRPMAPPAKSNSPQSTTSADILRFIKTAKPSPVVVTPYTRYDMQSALGRIVAFTLTVDGADELAILRIALPDRNSRCRIVEIRPAPQADLAFASQGNLPPMPSGAESLARRSDRHGRTLAEVISTNMGPDAVADAWRSQGWTVTDVRQVDACRQVDCQRGGRLCTAWFIPGPNHEQMAFVVATPSAQDD